MIKQNNNLELNEFQIKRDQSNDTYKFGTELCFTNQRNQNDRVKTGHTVIKSDRKCGTGQIRSNLSMLTLEVSVITALGLPPLRSKPNTCTKSTN